MPISSTKKKILILGPAYPLRGGLAAFNERLAYALQEQGYEVMIYTFSLQYPSFLFPGKTQYVDGPAPEGLEIHQKLNSINPFNWWSVGRAIRKEAPDLVITRFWLPFMGPSLGTSLRVARWGSQLPIVAIIDNIIPHEKRPGDFPLAKYFTGAVDAFLVMSRSVQEEMKRFVKAKPVIFHPHPIYDHYGALVDRTTALSFLSLAEDKRYLLFFGFIRDYKGLDLLLKAMAEPILADENIHLIVAGEYYGNQEKYEALIAELGIADRISIRSDYIPNDEVAYYFGAADLVVQPYKTATQSGISQMAYHFEKPMVVTAVGGLPEIVPDGVAGYVVERAPAAIATAIADFFVNKRKQSLEEGVRKRKELFSWEAFVEQLEKLWQLVA